MKRLPKEERVKHLEKLQPQLLTVKELIEKLSAFDGDKRVMIYESASEEGGMVTDVTLQTLNNEYYFKADHPFYYLDIDEAVCIVS
jgi:hypothetical protein